MMRVRCTFLVLAVASLAATPSLAQGLADAGDDAGYDAGLEEPDAGAPEPDAGPDPIVDAGPDPLPDAGPDPIVDAGPDPLPDAGPDPIVDAGPDPLPDAGPDPVVDAGPDPLPDAGLEPVDAGGGFPPFDAGPPGGECTPRCIDDRREGRCSSTGQLVPIVCGDDERCDVDQCVPAALAGTTGFSCAQGGDDTTIAFLALLFGARLLRRRTGRSGKGAPP